MKIEILKSFGPYSEGQIVKADDNDPHWRRRLKEAERDGACQIAKRRKPTKPAEPAPASDEGSKGDDR